MFSIFGTSKKSDSSDSSLPNTQFQQRSHSHEISAIASGPDLSTTLSQLSENHTAPLRIIDVSDGTKSLDASVTEFVKTHENPLQTAVFVIDGEKDSKESIICTTNDRDGGKTCLKFQDYSIELFKTMQRLEYFCSLPDDIDATYFECRKIK
ncbi:uncharacterized protein RJT21DRAFT_125725 [Scheffersomyces amazonensis]|uniref:uncharacterized protein n=1 Tax=Scheffersomyces amazonensis TaxID=1078765 RepID=UPI00315C5282